jgi:hypothetical protein
MPMPAREDLRWLGGDAGFARVSTIRHDCRQTAHAIPDESLN